MAGEGKLFLLLTTDDAGFICGQEGFLVLTPGSGSHQLDMVREAVPSRAAETTCPQGVARCPREEGWAGLGLSNPCSQTLHWGMSLVGTLVGCLMGQRVGCHMTEATLHEKKHRERGLPAPSPKHTSAINRKCKLKSYHGQ